MAARYRLVGDGPEKILVLPGWFGDETMLDPLASSLDLERYGFAVLAYRGYGVARAEAGDFTLEEIAGDALRAADTLDWARFAVLGHSMGGKVAQLVALRAPARVRGIVALTPVPAQAVPFDEAGWALFAGAAEDVAKRAAIIDFSTGGRLTRVWSEGLARRSFAGSTVAAFRSYLEAWAKSDFSREVAGSALPLLAVVGAHDPQINEEVMRETYLASYPKARLEVIGNAGHYPIDEAPVATATVMQAFLDGLA